MTDANRRHCPRVDVDFVASLSILVPEDKFQPEARKVRVTNISESGAMIEASLEQNVYRALLQRTRYCKLLLTGTDELPEKLVGIAVWIQPEKVEEAMTYKLGLYFEDVSAAAGEKLRSLVQNRQQQQPQEA